MSNPPIPFFVHGRLPESSPGDDPYFFAHSAASSLLANVQVVLGVVNALSKELVAMPLLADQLKRHLVNLDGNVQWLWRALKPATSEFTATADKRLGALRLCDQSGPNVHDIVGKVGFEVIGKSVLVGLRGLNRISNVLSADDLDEVRKALSEFDPKEIDALRAECDREYQLTCRRLDIPVRDSQAEASGLWPPETTPFQLTSRHEFPGTTSKSNDDARGGDGDPLGEPTAGVGQIQPIEDSIVTDMGKATSSGSSDDSREGRDDSIVESIGKTVPQTMPRESKYKHALDFVDDFKKKNRDATDKTALLVYRKNNSRRTFPSIEKHVKAIQQSRADNKRRSKRGDQRH